MKKQAIVVFLMLLAVPLMSGCGMQGELADSAVDFENRKLIVIFDNRAVEYDITELDELGTVSE